MPDIPSAMTITATGCPAVSVLRALNLPSMECVTNYYKCRYFVELIERDGQLYTHCGFPQDQRKETV